MIFAKAELFVGKKTLLRDVCDRLVGDNPFELFADYAEETDRSV
jgi:hypothetical protein